MILVRSKAHRRFATPQTLVSLVNHDVSSSVSLTPLPTSPVSMKGIPFIN
jgi:hypothetical protein